MLPGCLWKVYLVEMPLPEPFDDGPIPFSSKGEGETRDILQADFSYFSQAFLNVSSEIIISG